MGKLLSLPSSEEKLIQQCRKGRPEAQRALYERYSPSLMAVCRRYLGSSEDAEEALSNSFIKIFRRLDQYRGEGALAAWMRRIAVNEALDFLRYRKNHFSAWPEKGLEAPAQEQEQSDEADQLLQMIESLPLGYKTVFNLYAIEGYSHREIAELLGISEGTSKSQLSKARRELQSQMNACGLIFKKISP